MPVDLDQEVDVVTFPLGENFDATGLRFCRAANPFRIRSVPVGFSIRKILLDLSRPADVIRSRLLELDGTPSTFGSRVGPVEFGWAQLRLRLPNSCASAAKPVQPSTGT